MFFHWFNENNTAKSQNKLVNKQNLKIFKEKSQIFANDWIIWQWQPFAWTLTLPSNCQRIVYDCTVFERLAFVLCIAKPANFPSLYMRKTFTKLKHIGGHSFQNLSKVLKKNLGVMQRKLMCWACFPTLQDNFIWVMFEFTQFQMLWHIITGKKANPTKILNFSYHERKFVLHF